MVQLRGDEKARYVAAMFDRISRRYDLLNHMLSAGVDVYWRRRAVHSVQLDDGIPVLDVCTGTGDLALALARRPGIDRAVGLDLLPQMVEQARAKAATKGLTEKTAITVGDAMRLPFPDDSFVCVTSGFSLRNMPDLTGALAEMARVAQPGGRIAILELTPMKRGPWPVLFRFYFHRAVPLMGRLVAGNSSAYTYLPRSVDYFPDADTLAGMLGDLGLIEVGYRRMGLGAVCLHWGIKPPR